ncbi:hypothetical protein ACQP2F_15555 [Actinoplanes sp. CA-030573]|uniref:hypothetical protein n=1 Tax=Actinoplanes sp. CA-030573 TaxID=3239898 RepID=UPI003D8B485C
MLTIPELMGVRTAAFQPMITQMLDLSKKLSAGSATAAAASRTLAEQNSAVTTAALRSAQASDDARRAAGLFLSVIARRVQEFCDGIVRCQYTVRTIQTAAKAKGVPIGTDFSVSAVSGTATPGRDAQLAHQFNASLQSVCATAAQLDTSMAKALIAALDELGDALTVPAQHMGNLRSAGNTSLNNLNALFGLTAPEDPNVKFAFDDGTVEEERLSTSPSGGPLSEPPAGPASPGEVPAQSGTLTWSPGNGEASLHLDASRIVDGGNITYHLPGPDGQPSGSDVQFAVSTDDDHNRVLTVTFKKGDGDEVWQQQFHAEATYHTGSNKYDFTVGGRAGAVGLAGVVTYDANLGTLTSEGLTVRWDENTGFGATYDSTSHHLTDVNATYGIKTGGNSSVVPSATWNPETGETKVEVNYTNEW